MTTFAYRDGILAADTQVTQGNLSITRTVKIGKIGPFLYGAVGNAARARAFLEWCRGGCQGNPPSMVVQIDGEEAFKAYGILFLGDDRVLTARPDGLNVTTMPYFADGSGGDIALGALAHGANAIEAVEAAIKHDVFSSAPITILRAHKETP